MTAGSAFDPCVALCVRVCFEDIFLLHVFLIWILKKVIKACCKNDPVWRPLLCPLPSPGNWEPGESVGTEKSTYFWGKSDFLLPANREMKAALQRILRKLSKCTG